MKKKLNLIIKKFKTNEIQEIESEIREKEGIEVAEKAMSDGSKLLAEHLKAGKLDPEKLKKDNSLIQMSMERKRKVVSDLCDLRKKKARLTQSKK